MIYLINTKTKEHIDAMALGGSRYEKFARPPGWVVRVADADGWIELPGGLNECPVPDDTRIEYRMASGEEVETTAPQCKRWDHNIGISSDIIAYRPILDEPKQATMGGQLLWQDAAGTIPVTEYGQPVGLVGEPPAWDGEGLPPVGCECEFEYLEVGGWVDAKVIGYDGPACVVALDGFGYFGSDRPSDFRPTRSEEDRAVEAMLALDDYDTESYNSEMMSRDDFCRALYRDGYRKQEVE